MFFTHRQVIVLMMDKIHVRAPIMSPLPLLGNNRLIIEGNSEEKEQRKTSLYLKLLVAKKK